MACEKTAGFSSLLRGILVLHHTLAKPPFFDRTFWLLFVYLFCAYIVKAFSQKPVIDKTLFIYFRMCICEWSRI